MQRLCAAPALRHSRAPAARAARAYETSPSPISHRVLGAARTARAALRLSFPSSVLRRSLCAPSFSFLGTVDCSNSYPCRPTSARPQAPLQLSASRVQIRAFSATSAVFSAAASPLNLSLRPQPFSALSSRTNSSLFPRLHLSVSTRSALRRYLLAGSQQQRSISSAIHPTWLEGLAGREHARDSKREEPTPLSPKAVELGTRLIASVALLLIGAAIWVSFPLCLPPPTYAPHRLSPPTKKRSQRSSRARHSQRRCSPRSRRNPFM